MCVAVVPIVSASVSCLIVSCLCGLLHTKMEGREQRSKVSRKQNSQLETEAEEQIKCVKPSLQRLMLVFPPDFCPPAAPLATDYNLHLLFYIGNFTFVRADKWDKIEYKRFHFFVDNLRGVFRTWLWQSGLSHFICFFCSCLHVWGFVNFTENKNSNKWWNSKVSRIPCKGSSRKLHLLTFKWIIEVWRCCCV